MRHDVARERNKGGGMIMETILFITRQRTAKLFTVGVIGLAVLLGSSGVTLAGPKDRLVSVRQCLCACKRGDGEIRVFEWGWKAGQQCNAIGKNCTSDPGNASSSGQFIECSECLAKNLTTGKYSQCQKFANANISTAPGGGVIKPPAERGDPVPSTDPFSKSGMNAPIMKRGVEGEQPDTGMSNPSSPPSENK